ncbi:MAG: recombinase family protein [Rubrobacteraceae bacterium]
MPSENGSGPKTAVLYSRVSTREQAEKGYSLAQQLEALREYARREGYEVLEEVADPGQSGASLERPGMDRVRDLVGAGGVAVVLAQDRDRFSREPAYTYLLKREFEEQGTLLRALNDRGDDSPEGQLTDGILDQLSKFERAKMAERLRRGKLRKAREGKLIAGRFPRYGFKLNAERNGYEVDEDKMGLVRRVFRMIGEEGMSIRGAARTLDGEGVPTPGGGKFWDRTTLRNWILDDSYRPHAFEEVRGLVAPGVVSELDSGKSYGILWWGRRSATTKQVSEASPGVEGRQYRKTYRYKKKPKSEQIPIPVPDSGISPELVEAAREAVKGNRAPSAAGGRFWDLSGGIARCACCGRTLQSRGRNKKKNGKTYRYHYYRCSGYDARGFEGCENSRFASATKIERQVWQFVRGVILDPEQLREDLDRMIDLERREERGDPEREAKHWLDKLSDLDTERRGHLRQNARGVLEDRELDAELSRIEEERRVAERGLDSLESRRERIGQMEHDRDALLDYYAEMTPEALDSLTHEERHQFYKMLRLQVLVSKDGSLEVWIAAGPAYKAETGGERPGEFFQTREHMGICPHGRPIVKRVKVADLLREFGRT